MITIDRPGIYRSVAERDYRADPCLVPSLTQSLAKIMLERSPRHAWIASPTLNPQFVADDATKFDLGNVAHALMLGRGKDFEIVDADDWRTKAAREQREAAIEAGRVAVLHEQFDRAAAMVEAARISLMKHEDRNAFTQGDAEVMLVWEEDGIWFRTLVDWMHYDLRTIDDYKTSGMSMAPHVLGLRAEAGGWHIQAAFIERGLNVLDPTNAGRRTFRFIAQETDAPHALTVAHMDEHWMTMGRKKVDVAVQLWRMCMKTGEWPAYTQRGVVPEYPSFKEAQWLAREESGELDPKVLMAG